MGLLDSHIIRYSRGTGKNFGKVKSQTKSWPAFVKFFQHPHRTAEKFREYLKLSKAEQLSKKSENGWYFRSATDGPRRNRSSALPSDLITLDFDYATPEFLKLAEDGDALRRTAYFIHSSRSHTPEKPRFRMVIPVNEPIPNDLYNAVSRVIAFKIDSEMDKVDPVSFRPAQMMFFPTASKDQDYVFAVNEGGLLDWRAELDAYELLHGDWRDITKLPRAEHEETLREIADKAEDPTAKHGIVGAFCRAYNIFDAIDKFDLPYSPVDAPSGKPRYTYTEGSTTNGAEVQDDGLFLYSHHGSDPASDQLLNSFDLVRIHKFSDLDEDIDRDSEKYKNPKNWPSYQALEELVKGDQAVKTELIADRYDFDAMQADFDEVAEISGMEVSSEIEEERDVAEEIANWKPADLTAEEERELDEIAGLIPGTKKNKDPRRVLKPKKGWHQDLEVDQNGNIKNTIANTTAIMCNDLRLMNSIAYNQLAEREVLIRPLATKLPYVTRFEVEDPKNGDPFEDKHLSAVRYILDAENGPGKTGWGYKPALDTVKTAINLAAHRRSFNPITEILDTFKPEPKAVAESLFPKFFGTPDTPYYREVGLLILTAAVVRAYEPGAKFDYVPVLIGGQGTRKSTAVEVLALGFCTDLGGDFKDHKTMVETMQGNWWIELAELSSIQRSAIEDMKAFISGKKTDARMAYAQYKGVHRRRQVFMGTTNDEHFLRDKTGNRRFWPIKLDLPYIDTDALQAAMPALYGSAVAYYRELRRMIPTGNLPLYLRHPDAQAEALRLQGAAEIEDESDALRTILHPMIYGLQPPFRRPDGRPYLPEKICIAQFADEEEVKALRLNPTMLRRHMGHALRRMGFETTNRVDHFDGISARQKVFEPGEEAKEELADLLERWEIDKTLSGGGYSEHFTDDMTQTDDDDPEALI
jgi:putative DNA primase/helicase